MNYIKQSKLKPVTTMMKEVMRFSQLFVNLTSQIRKQTSNTLEIFDVLSYIIWITNILRLAAIGAKTTQIITIALVPERTIQLLIILMVLILLRKNTKLHALLHVIFGQATSKNRLQPCLVVCVTTAISSKNIMPSLFRTKSKTMRRS